MFDPEGAENPTAQAQSLLDQARRAGTERGALAAENDGAQRAVNDELASTYLTWLGTAKGATRGTVVNYAGVLSHYLDHCVGGRPFDTVSAEEVQAWLMRPRGGRARGQVAAPATRARNLTIVRTFYGWMLLRGAVASNVPALCVAPKVHNRNPRPLRDETWLHTFPSLDLEGRICMGLMFYLGLRRQEVVTLRGTHFDHSQGILAGFIRKGGGDDVLPYREMMEVYTDRLPHLLCGRSVDSICGEWERYADTHRGELFGFDPDGVNKRFLRWCDGAFTPHQLRHSAATNLLRAGLPLDMVSWLMNHGSIEVTMRYVKQSGSRLREWRSQGRDIE